MNIIKINKNNNIVLIDCSYYILHRYFATMRWYKFQKDFIEIDVNKNIDNQVFINAFCKHIENDIKKICKIWKTKINNIILCNDCLRSNIWRNDIYDKYKATRNIKNNFNKNIFSIFNEYIKKIGLQSIQSDRLEGDDIIYLTPDGETLKQQTANELSLKGNLLLLCGHYKGIDQRIRELYVTKEISIGDYVLSGGELAAAVLVDSIVRLIPGVLNDETSALSDSFQDDLLSPPVYTRPADFRGHKVPDILLSGNTPEVEKWRFEQALAHTKARRPDLLS